MFQISDLIAIVAAGVLGCFATGVAVHLAAGIPLKVATTQPGKYLWSVIFAAPLPFLLPIGTLLVGLVVSYLVLMLLPTIASKLYFGPKQVPAPQLMVFNSVYAVVAIAVFLAVRGLL